MGGQAAQRLLLASPGSANFLVKRRGRGERAPSLEERRWSGRGGGGRLVGKSLLPADFKGLEGWGGWSQRVAGE